MLNRLGKVIRFFLSQSFCGTRFRISIFEECDIVARVTKGVSTQVFANAEHFPFVEATTAARSIGMVFGIGRTERKCVVLVCLLGIGIGTNLRESMGWLICTIEWMEKIDSSVVVRSMWVMKIVIKLPKAVNGYETMTILSVRIRIVPYWPKALRAHPSCIGDHKCLHLQREKSMQPQLPQPKATSCWMMSMMVTKALLLLFSLLLHPTSRSCSDLVYLRALLVLWYWDF